MIIEQQLSFRTTTTSVDGGNKLCFRILDDNVFIGSNL